MLRLLTLARRITQSNLGWLDRPYRLTLSVTNKCACKCSICGIWKSDDDRDLTLDELDAIFAKAGHFSWVNLTGGEPLLRNDLVDIIGMIDRRSPHLYLLNFPTSGVYPDETESLVKQVLAATRIPRLVLTVSMDGPPDLHDDLRGMAGCWKRAIDTYLRLRNMQSRRFSVMLGLTIQEANVSRLHETLAALTGAIKGFSPNELHLNISHTSPHYYRNMDCSGIPAPDATWEFLQDYRAARTWSTVSPLDFMERRYIELAKKFLNTDRTPLPCAAGTASCFISANGTLYPCTGMDFPVGNLHEAGYDLSSLFSSPLWREGQHRVVTGNCPHCWTPCEASNAILASLTGNRT